MNRHEAMKFASLLSVGVLAGAFGAGALRPASSSAHAAAQPAEMGQMLVQGLLATEGCLGVELAQTQSGKNVIFAWFENKAAARRWYDSQAHQGVMRAAMPGFVPGPDHEPMAGVPDDVPVLAVASLRFSDRPMIEGARIPISEIAIELYTPLNGGVFLNGRFAPESLKIEGMNNAGAP